MSSVFNQFSAVIAFIILALAVLALVLWRVPLGKRRLVLLIGTAVIIVAGFFLFQPVHDGVTAVSVADVMAEGNDRPVLVEFYSDYWLACLQAKPVVDRLEAEWGDTVQVMRVNVQAPSAQPLLAELGFRFTPTFILLNSRGQEVWRSMGSINPDIVNEQINDLE